MLTRLIKILSKICALGCLIPLAIIALGFIIRLFIEIFYLFT